MHHHHVLDLPEITSLLVAYLSPHDVLSCLCVCRHWHSLFEQELWRRIIISHLAPLTTTTEDPLEDHKQHSRTGRRPSCRYCVPRTTNGSSSFPFFGPQDHNHLHGHPTRLTLTRRLDLDLVKAKGHLIQSLESLDLRETPLLTAVAMHCVHLRHLELVVATRAPSLKGRMWPTLPWKVEEASSAVEAFMKAVARVGKHGELIEIPHDNDGAKSFSTVPTRGYGMGLESVCVVFEDNDSDFRLLWSLRHLPNLRKLEIQGQWVNRIVRDKVVFWLEDLVILLERCVRIEEVVLSNLQLVSGALNAGDRYCGDTRARRGRHFETLLEAPLESSSSALPKTSSSSSLKSLALFIFPRRIDVYLILLDTVGPALQGLDLYFVEWNCHLPESTENMLSLLSACPVLRTLTIRLKPNFARESTALQNMPRFTNMQHLSILEGRSKLHDCHHGQHDPPATRPCLDFAELATVFPLTLTALTLTGVQIELTNLLHVDPKHVQGVMQLRVLYRRSCVCPVEVLERVLSVWRGLVTLEMGALYGEDHHSNMSSNANYLNFEEQQQQQQQGETGTSSRDRRLVEAMRGSNWACRYTLRQLDLCQMDVHLYPGYCELLLGRIRELVGLRDLRVDMRCFRVRQSKMKKVEGTGTGTGTGTFITSAAGGQATGDVEEVDLSLRPKFEWRQLDRLFVHGERYVSGSWGFGATVEWFEPLRVDEMRWIQEEVLSPQCKFLYCHFGEWREMKNETEQ